MKSFINTECHSEILFRGLNLYVYENKVGWEKWCREELNPEKIEKSDGSLVPTLETKNVSNYFQCYRK